MLASSLQRRQAASASRAARPCNAPRALRLAVRAHGHPHGQAQGHGGAATGTAEKQEKEKGFINEMRMVAMKLHTKDQSPKEGGRDVPKEEKKPWAPTLKGYLRFLAESKVVYDALEKTVQDKAHPEYKRFQTTGLERGAGLARDMAFFKEKFGLSPPELKEDGPGHTYARMISRIAEVDPPAFICHFYNFYFAHTAGGRMIGSSVSKSLLDSHTLEFYKWDGDVNVLLDGVRRSINEMAEGWSQDQKSHCLQETETSFKYSGVIMKCITEAD